MHTSVVRHPLENWVEPDVAFSTLYSESANSFWLDSGIDASAGKSYCGASTQVISVPAGTSATAFVEHVAATLAEHRVLTDTAAAALGWVGWLGYELRSLTLGDDSGTVRSRYPDAAMMFVDRCLEFDHQSKQVSLVAIGQDWTGELLQWRDATVSALANPFPLPRPAVAIAVRSAIAPTVTWHESDAQYRANIAACQAAIIAGEAYQLCLTTEASVDAHPDPVRTYLALRASSPTHHGGFLRVGEVSVVSASPEQYLSVSPGGVIESAPIKGTRRRDVDPLADEALRDELAHNEKERAENLMIVDLMRNDIGKISVVGSVSVPSLHQVESYAHVHQLVSRVRGQLLPGVTGFQAALSCFPAGSMTGAPKQRATVILEGLEKRARGIYSGAFGRFGIDGSVDLAMVIRSIIIDADGVTIGAGGGITVDSIPSEELAEVKLKAAALLAVLGA